MDARIKGFKFRSMQFLAVVVVDLEVSDIKIEGARLNSKGNELGLAENRCEVAGKKLWHDPKTEKKRSETLANNRNDNTHQSTKFAEEQGFSLSPLTSVTANCMEVS